MRKLIVAAILAISLVLVAVPAAVSAVAPVNTKVFVCKYVGTPGEDETLQTGQNPISVSVNAIQDWDGTIPAYFADQQGRSYVLEYDNGQEEPSVTECPDGDTPEDPEVLAASAVVLTVDATCEVGETLVYGDIENASFSGTADGTTGPVAYSVTATADQDAEFDDQGTQELVFEGELTGPLDDVSCDEGEVLGEDDPETTPVLPTTSGQGGTIALVSGASLLALAAAAGARRLLTRSI